MSLKSGPKYEPTPCARWQLMHWPLPTNNVLPREASAPAGRVWPAAAGKERQLLIAVDGSHPSYNTESVSFGGEWSWKDILALRMGYQNLAQQDSEVGLTFGGGLKGRFGEHLFAFDYAWADQGRLQETQRFSFVVTL